MRLYVLVSMHSWIMNDFVDSHALNFTVLAVLDCARVTFGQQALTETKNSFLKYWNRRAAPLKQPAHPEQPAQVARSSFAARSSSLLIPK
jgi:hypothetical protein